VVAQRVDGQAAAAGDFVDTQMLGHGRILQAGAHSRSSGLCVSLMDRMGFLGKWGVLFASMRTAVLVGGLSFLVGGNAWQVLWHRMPDAQSRKGGV
ncbi:MAG: hypothetical protein Q4D19_05865, partial [Lautropia sp.]|nr:hypothetical protein [Lautropia sp.]